MTQADSNLNYEAVARRLNQDASELTHWPLTGGVSANIEALEYKMADGSTRRVVVRRHGAAEWKELQDDVTTREYNLQQTLYSAGLPVPEPLLLDVSCEVLPSPYLVMAMVDGTSTVDEQHLEDAIEQMANFLLRLHSLDTQPLAGQLASDDHPVTGALQYIPDTPEHAALSAKVAGWKTEQETPALLHGDFWPGNILWQNHTIAAVIDWEDASIGAVESDLAGCRSELMVMYGEEAMHTFTEKYLAGTDRNIVDLPVWEVYASHAALATLSEWGLPPEDEAHRRARTTQFAERAVKELMAR